MEKYKLIFYFALAVLLAVLPVSCGSQNTPKATVQKFFDAVENNDLAAMEEVTTEETMQLIALYGWKIKGAIAENGKVKSMSQAIEDNYAVVTVTFENGEKTDVELINSGGQWKIIASMNK